MAARSKGRHRRKSIAGAPSIDMPQGLTTQEVYASLASHFAKDEVGLKGFAQFFQSHAPAKPVNNLSLQQIDAMLVQEPVANKPGVATEPKPFVESVDTKTTPEDKVEANSEGPGAEVQMTPAQAFAANDAEASKAAHSSEEVKLRVRAAPEEHSQIGGRLKSIVYGGLDGIITTFAVVAGATGGHLDSDVILILGISNMFADALSMGMVGHALQMMQLMLMCRVML